MHLQAPCSLLTSLQGKCPVQSTYQVHPVTPEGRSCHGTLHLEVIVFSREVHGDRSSCLICTIESSSDELVSIVPNSIICFVFFKHFVTSHFSICCGRKPFKSSVFQIYSPRANIHSIYHEGSCTSCKAS